MFFFQVFRLLFSLSCSLTFPSLILPFLSSPPFLYSCLNEVGFFYLAVDLVDIGSTFCLLVCKEITFSAQILNLKFVFLMIYKYQTYFFSTTLFSDSLNCSRTRTWTNVFPVHTSPVSKFCTSHITRDDSQWNGPLQICCFWNVLPFILCRKVTEMTEGITFYSACRVLCER